MSYHEEMVEGRLERIASALEQIVAETTPMNALLWRIADALEAQTGQQREVVALQARAVQAVELSTGLGLLKQAQEPKGSR